ncbi:uncharacterized protein LOC128309235 [Anopheles moucheti]|uniref:uncharacterized protein LOC128309235 n=1 Tax=Anopheles moucheti TaxID=186751 RepID=UPI0022F11058|nr:uncharacterized protein LOC128309235 [Anopheles moucheti]
MNTKRFEAINGKLHNAGAFEEIENHPANGNTNCAAHPEHPRAHDLATIVLDHDHSYSSINTLNPGDPIPSTSSSDPVTNNQGESVSGQLAALAGEIRCLREGQEYLLTTFEYAMETVNTHRPISSFKVQTMKSREELQNFDAQLSDAEFMKKVVSFIKTETGEHRQMYIMHKAIDILFSPELMAACSWSGVGIPHPKIAFKPFRNILQLFSVLGASGGDTLPAYKVMEYFKGKFYHAKQRLNTFKNVRASAPRSIRSYNRLALQNIVNNSTT